MKKINLLFIGLCICLAGCNKTQAANFDNSSEPEVVEVDNTTTIDPAKRDFPTEEIEGYYKEQLKENIAIPTYDNTKEDIYFDVKITYDYRQFRIYANNTTEIEYEQYLNTLTNNGWYEISNKDTDATFKFDKTRARVDFYKVLDYIEEPYIVIIFSADAKTYDSLQIMKDVVITQFGFIEEGIILEPDEQGIIRSSRDIMWDVEDFKDEEDHTEGDYLRKALHDLLALSVDGHFPGYLFYDWYNTPTYEEDQNIAEVYLGTYTLEYVLYMYSRYDGDLVRITFMTGPRAAFPHAFEEGE